ncbi:hypothetical protein CJO94_05990 [Ralstonia solanacearum]|nr:hypothetical protein CJO94_05990 [Ralstonia solanacearum]
MDVKNKKSPKAFERVLWVKGVQAVLKCDRAIVATTDMNPALARFAQSNGVGVLAKVFLERLEKKLVPENRLTWEQFVEQIQENASHKKDGDWLKVLGEAKSAVASLPSFPAFNKTMLAFRFFAERAEVRPQFRAQALRCAMLCGALACVALDAALERFVYDEPQSRHIGLLEGVTYGDAGDGRVRQSIETALGLLAEGMANGKAIAAQARDHLSDRLEAIRADVIAEHFMRETNAQHLYLVAKELEEWAFSQKPLELPVFSVEARTILGVFADFVMVKRTALPLSGANPSTHSNTLPSAGVEDSGTTGQTVATAEESRQQPLL